MKRALIVSAVAGTLLLASAGAANADGLWFNVHIGTPLFGERYHAPPPVVVVPSPHWRHRPAFYWGRPHYPHRGWEGWRQRPHDWGQWRARHHDWRAYRFHHDR